jgi:hypothetical protein
VRDIPLVHFLDSNGVLVSHGPWPPCGGADMRAHDWAYLTFDEMIVAVVCRTCGRSPIDVMSMWKFPL